MKIFLIFFMLSAAILAQDTTKVPGRLQQQSSRMTEGLNKLQTKVENMKVRISFIEKLIEGRRLLQWSGGDPDSDVVTYKVYFGEDSTNLFLTAITRDTFCLSGVQQRARTYYWQVTASDQDTTVSGPIWHYSTIPDTVRIALHFDEPMDSSSLRNGRYVVTSGQDTMPLYAIGFYTPINRDSILSVALFAGLYYNRIYTIEAFNVRDKAGNLINPDKNKAIIGYPELLPLNFNQFGNNEVLGNNFNITGFNIFGTGNICTNYGYNFNVNRTSLFYLFKNISDDKLTITYPHSLDFRGLSFCQLSGLSEDTLLVEGFKEGSMKYQSKHLYDNQWTDLLVDYKDVDKIVISILKAGAGIADFNFDQFLFMEAQ